MPDDWPFLHLNLPSSSVSHQLATPNPHDLSLFPFDSRQLDAWTNINFSFDDPARYSASSPGLPSKSSLPSSQDPFQLLGPSAPSDAPHPFLDPAGLLFGQPDQFPHPDQHQSPKTDVFESSLRPILPSPSDHSSPGTGAHPQKNTHLSSAFSHTAQQAECTLEDHCSSVKHDNTSPNSHDDDDANRIALEEDKRRRNTLASAKFRMKKKMKEQEIERTAREMKERVCELEKEVESLKQENKWLRGLIVDSTASKLVQARELEKTTTAATTTSSSSSATTSLTGMKSKTDNNNGRQKVDQVQKKRSRKLVEGSDDDGNDDNDGELDGDRRLARVKHLKKS